LQAADVERVAVRRAAGKLFQMTGPATTKLLVLSVVLVLGTNGNPVPADRRSRLLAIAEIGRQSSAKYVGANPYRHLKTVMASLYLIRWRTGSLWKSRSTGV